MRQTRWCRTTLRWRCVAAQVTGAIVACLVSHSAVAWSPPIEIRPGTLHEDRFPNMVTGPGGSPWMVWMGLDRSEGDEEAFFTRWNGDSWEPAGLINPPNQVDDRFPRISCARDGSLWTLWTTPDLSETGNYAGVASRWTGISWSAPDTIWTGGSRQDAVEIAAVSAHEAWFVRDGGSGAAGDSDVRVYHLTNGVLAPVVHFSDPDIADRSPRIVVDQSGVVWVTWRKVPRVSPDDSRLTFVRRIGGRWGVPRSLPAPLGVIRNTLSIDQNDTKWIVCSGRDSEAAPNREAVWAIRWDGSDWGRPERISIAAATNSTLYHLSASRGCAGYPRAVWVQGSVFTAPQGEIVSVAWNGSRWSKAQPISAPDHSRQPEWPAVAIEPSGRIWVAYGQPTGPRSFSIVTTHLPYTGPPAPK